MSAILVKALWIYGLAAGVAALIAAVIRGVVWLLGRMEAQTAAGPAPASSRPTSGPGTGAAGSLAAAADTDTIAPEHIAVIAAAVAATMGARRLVRIDDPHSGASWSARGRAAHHGSHQLPTRHTGR